MSGENWSDFGRWLDERRKIEDAREIFEEKKLLETIKWINRRMRNDIGSSRNDNNPSEKTIPKTITVHRPEITTGTPC